MNEKYQPETETEATESPWQSLAEMPDFTAHEAVAKAAHESQPEVGQKAAQEIASSATRDLSRTRVREVHTGRTRELEPTRIARKTPDSRPNSNSGIAPEANSESDSKPNSDHIDDVARDIERALDANRLSKPESSPADDEMIREIGSVVDDALKERAEQKSVPDEAEDDPNKTQELKVDILDDNWFPDADKKFYRALSDEERYKRNWKDLATLDTFLRQTPERQMQQLDTLNGIISAMKDDIRQYRKGAESFGVPPEEMQGYNDLYELACERRRELQLLENAEVNRKMLRSQQVRLGRELVKDDPRYHDAIEGMDSDIINQNMDAIIESTPPRDFEKLAKLMNRPDKFPKFRKEVQDVLVRALGLEDVNIDVEMFAGDAKGEKGSCTPTEDGYLVRLNSTQIGQDTWSYAQVLAHELYHVMQGRVSEAGGTDMAELYDFNMEHYGRPEIVGYQDYKSQIKEAEAFAFMDRFLSEIRAGETRNRQTLFGRLKHWWQERDTEKMPVGDDSPTEPLPTVEDAIMMKGEDDTDTGDGSAADSSQM